MKTATTKARSLLFASIFFAITFSGTAFAQLSGNYTIGTSGIEDYASFTAAVSDLNTNGISGAVVFDVSAGVYTEQFEITLNTSHANPTSASNTVSFKSATGLASDVEVSFTGLTDANNYLVALNGAEYISFSELTFNTNGNSTYANIFNIFGNTSNITIKNCTLNGDETAIGATASSIYLNGTNIDFITVTGNVLNDNAYGLHLTSSSGNEYEITGNQLLNQQTYGAYLRSMQTVLFNKNIVSSPEVSYAVFSNSVGTFTISQNVIHAAGGVGLRLYYAPSVDVVNNMITSKNDALQMASSGKVYYNTLYSESGEPTLNIGSNSVTRLVDIQNNIVMNAGAGVALEVQKVADIDVSDYNLFSTTGSILINWDLDGANEIFADLSEYQEITDFDWNSVSKPVNFINTTEADLHLDGASITDVDLHGTPIVSVLVDFDGDERSESVPYMGADEGNDSALPVELVAFNGRSADKNVVLTWQTASEINLAGFGIELNGSNGWERQQFVEATGSESSYQTTLGDLSAGRHQFRLKSIDTNGEFSYSSVVEVTVELVDSFELSPAYPNPFNPQTTFGLTVAESQNVTIEVFNTIGQKVATLHRGEIQSGQQANFTFDAINLTSGLYFIRVAGERFTVNHKVVLLK